MESMLSVTCWDSRFSKTTASSLFLLGSIGFICHPHSQNIMPHHQSNFGQSLVFNFNSDFQSSKYVLFILFCERIFWRTHLYTNCVQHVIRLILCWIFLIAPCQQSIPFSLDKLEYVVYLSLNFVFDLFSALLLRNLCYY